MEPIPYRIRLGVTGHRSDLDEDHIKAQVKEVLKTIPDYFDDKLKKLWFKDTVTPNSFSILSPLALGSDRIVAEEILNYPAATLDVVLPLTKEDYKNDFDKYGEQENTRFEELYNKAVSKFSLKKYKLAEDPETKDRQTEARNEAYEAVGKYVVDHCDILIAVFDKNRTIGHGGTGEILEYARKKGMLIFEITPQLNTNYSETNNTNKIPKQKVMFRSEDYQCFEVFNKRLIKEKDQKFIDKNFGYLFVIKDTDKNGNEIIDNTKFINENAKNHVKEMILPCFAVADTLAEKNQRIYRWAGVLVYIFSTLAVTGVVLGTFIPTFLATSFFIEFILLAFIAGFVLFAHRRRTHRNWLDNRFLAERLRSTCYFIATGTEIQPIEVPPYLGIAHQHSDWMIKAYNEIWKRVDKNMLKTFKAITLDNNPDNKKYLEDHKNYILKAWVLSQRKWHEDRLRSFSRFSKLFRVGIVVLFLLALIAALLHITDFFHRVDFLPEIWNKILVFLAIVLPAMAAAVEGIRTHREYSRMEKRTENMINVLRNLESRFDHIDEYDDLEKIMKEIDEVMLRENQDWMMLMKLVKLEVCP